MVKTQTVVKLALGLPGTTEMPHFNRRAFRTPNRIYATLSESDRTLNLKLEAPEQSIYASLYPLQVYPVNGGWGRKGWTTANLNTISLKLLRELVQLAYRESLQPAGKQSGRKKR